MSVLVTVGTVCGRLQAQLLCPCDCPGGVWRAGRAAAHRHHVTACRTEGGCLHIKGYRLQQLLLGCVWGGGWGDGGGRARGSGQQQGWAMRCCAEGHATVTAQSAGHCGESPGSVRSCSCGTH